jgi:hypothetical protein
LSPARYPASSTSVGADRAAPLYPDLAFVPELSVRARRDRSEPVAVLVIAPGGGALLGYYIGVAEDLASYGFFVIAIDSLPLTDQYPDGWSISPRNVTKSFEVLQILREVVDEFFRVRTTGAAIFFACEAFAEVE